MNPTTKMIWSQFDYNNSIKKKQIDYSKITQKKKKSTKKLWLQTGLVKEISKKLKNERSKQLY